MDIRCNNCGVEYPGSLKLCPFCGMDNSIRSTVEIPEPEMILEEQPKVVVAEEPRKVEEFIPPQRTFVEKTEEPEPATDFWKIEKTEPVPEPEVVVPQQEKPPFTPVLKMEEKPIAQFKAPEQPKPAEWMKVNPQPEPEVKPQKEEASKVPPLPAAIAPVSSFKPVEISDSNKKDDKEDKKVEEKTSLEVKKEGVPSQEKTAVVNAVMSDKDKPLSVASFIGHSLLFSIPIVGIIMIIIYAVGGNNTNTNLTNWSRAILLVALISLGISLLFFGREIFYLLRYM